MYGKICARHPKIAPTWIMPSIRVYCDLFARQHALLDTRHHAVPQCLERGAVVVVVVVKL